MDACFEALALPAIAEVVAQHVTRSRDRAILDAVALVGLPGKVYELVEWLEAIAMSPAKAAHTRPRSRTRFQSTAGASFRHPTSPTRRAQWPRRQRRRTEEPAPDPKHPCMAKSNHPTRDHRPTARTRPPSSNGQDRQASSAMYAKPGRRGWAAAIRHVAVAVALLSSESSRARSPKTTRDGQAASACPSRGYYW